MAGTKDLLEDLMESPEDFLEFWNQTAQLSNPEFKSALAKLRDHVIQVINTPREERGASLS